MGCCHNKSPCGSEEERSSLLRDDSKAQVHTGDTAVVATSHPESDDDMKKSLNKATAEVKGKCESVQVNGETETSNTQVNGPLQKESIQPASPHREVEPKENMTQDIKDSPGDGGQVRHLQCALSERKAAADWEVFKKTTELLVEENQASVQDTPTATAVHPEELSHTDITTAREHITDTGGNDDEPGSKVTSDDAVAEPSGESFPKVLSAPNTQLSAAAGQVLSSSAVSQEVDKEAQSSAVTENPNNGISAVCEEATPEDTKSHNVSDSPPGSEPAGHNHSGEKGESVREPDTTAVADASESIKSSQIAKSDPECAAMKLEEVGSSENIKQDTGEDQDENVSKAEEDDLMKNKQEEAGDAPLETKTRAGEDAEDQDTNGEDEQVAENADVEAEVFPVKKKVDEDELENSEVDLYRAAEELSQPTPVLEPSLKVEDLCSLDPAVDILSYSEREWKGNTAKSALIRKGYKEMSQRFGSLRRVRGDNYCALRATLFQVLSYSTQLPAWLQEEDITMLPKQLEAQEGLISLWTFPGECLQGDETGDATQRLKGYMERLHKTWQAAVDCSSASERQQLCERVFHGGEEELGLLEALKLLMLGRAVELHGCMLGGEDVPLFCWLLFARDSSDCPRSFLSNHLSHVGLSAGLEQVEMFLLGYALQCTIQVYRLYKADTEEFVTYYPDDHKDEWPSVCLVTEDDRHYNVPVVEATELHKELNTS